MAWFDIQIVLKIHEMSLDAGLHDKRSTMLQAMPVEYTSTLPNEEDDSAQLLSDLFKLNQRTEPLSDGTCPLMSWLTLAVHLTRVTPTHAEFFSKKLEALNNKQGIAPIPPVTPEPAVDPGEEVAAETDGRCPTKAMVITARAPFLDRHKDKVRDALRSLAGQDDCIFVTVKGLPKTGKSHIRLFLEYLVRTKWLKANLTTVRFDRRLQSPNQCDVAKAMSDLVVAMTEQQDECPSAWTEVETLNQYAEKVGKWFRDRMQQNAGDTYWIALDGFDKQNLNDCVAELFEKLISHVRDDLHHVRLLFLGYHGDPPAEHAMLGWHCEIVAPGDDDVRDFLGRIATHLEIADPNRFVEEWMLKIQREVPANAPDRLHQIARWCQDVAREHSIPIGV